jgi:hypothetical protein
MNKKFKNKKTVNNGNSISKNNIPQLSSNIAVNHIYRFTSNNATSTQITGKDLLGALGTLCTSSTNLYSMFESVKVNRVSIWAPPSSQGAFATCSVNWLGQSNSDTKEVSDTTVSVTTPAFVTTKPPRNSLSSFWQTPAVANNVLMSIIAPVGAVIDVNLSGLLNDDDVSGNAYTCTASSTGNTYYLPLDFYTNNTFSQFIPVSLHTIL